MSVPLIQLIVSNLSAHVSLDAKVASLVQLSVGVDIQVDEINLTIKDVQATVHLEARLHEVTKIVEVSTQHGRAGWTCRRLQGIEAKLLHHAYRVSFLCVTACSSVADCHGQPRCMLTALRVFGISSF